jgi:hypothetical protein
VIFCYLFSSLNFPFICVPLFMSFRAAFFFTNPDDLSQLIRISEVLLYNRCIQSSCSGLDRLYTHTQKGYVSVRFVTVITAVGHERANSYLFQCIVSIRLITDNILM